MFKSYSDISISFEKVDNNDEIIVKESSKIDVLNPSGNDYLKGIIVEVINTEEGKLLNITFEGKHCFINDYFKCK